MSWDDYHLNEPSFCTPLPVMRGLVSALCERREVVDSDFHESCMTSGTSAVIENQLAHMLTGKWYDEADPQEIPFREIRRESAYDELMGFSRRLSFMHIFDAVLVHTLEPHDSRQFSDSSGNTVYGTIGDLASALSENLIVPQTVPEGHSSGTVPTDGTLQVCLNAAWASQRARMLRLLRYVNVNSGGYAMRQAVSPDSYHAFGASPQEAYDAIPYWTFDEQADPPECRLEYLYTSVSDPDERWSIHSAWEPLSITPEYQGCPVTSNGTFRFDAVDPRQRDENGNPTGNGSGTYLFDPMCTTVSSGANTLVLSSGVFASWGYGTATSIGGPDTAPGNYIRGWQALNVKVIYDYESYFNFRQGE